MKCPLCGEEMNLVNGRPYCPRCDIFKKAYRSEWAKHRENVARLANEIKLRFPIVSIKRGLGAETSDWLDFPPEHKNEPDIQVWWKVHILSIEVTGSDKVKVPPSPIWILAKKLPVAQEALRKDKLYLFLAEYPNNSFILPVPLVTQHRFDTTTLDKSGVVEKYIEIPAEEALPRDFLFDIIKARLDGLAGPSSKESFNVYP